jgi:hemoglobin
MGKSWVVSGVMGLAAVLSLAATGCQSNAPVPLYDRLGGNVMISAVVEDFVGRAAGDPRVNFTRKGTSAEWKATPENVDKLKVHLTEFLAAATGGSEEYEGRDMRSVHAGMQISNGEFDAIKADLAKSLAKYDVPAKETAEVLAIVEGTRKDIVERK